MSLSVVLLQYRLTSEVDVATVEYSESCLRARDDTVIYAQTI